MAHPMGPVATPSKPGAKGSPSTAGANDRGQWLTQQSWGQWLTARGQGLTQQSWGQWHTRALVGATQQSWGRWHAQQRGQWLTQQSWGQWHTRALVGAIGSPSKAGADGTPNSGANGLPSKAGAKRHTRSMGDNGSPSTAGANGTPDQRQWLAQQSWGQRHGSTGPLAHPAELGPMAHPADRGNGSPSTAGANGSPGGTEANGTPSKAGANGSLGRFQPGSRNLATLNTKKAGDVSSNLHLPAGIFTPMTLPLQEMGPSDNPSIHVFDVIPSHAETIDFRDLEAKYKLAVLNLDLSLLPAPFCPRQSVPKDTKLQIFIVPTSDEKHYIIKHFVFASKCKACFFLASVYGKAHIYRWRAANPKVGKKILQYTLENLGCYQFKVFDLQTFSAAKNTNTRFEDKTDEEVDAGFDYIATEGPRSSSEMQQLRWMTKAIKNTSSPIFNWPNSLVEKALRNLATDGALAKKIEEWPIPFTSTFYHTWVLDIFEKVWDFDTSALVLLGEAGAGKSPLGRSVLMAQVRHNQIRFSSRQKPCIRCTPEIDFLRGEQGHVAMGDFLDDTTIKWLSNKMLKSLLDVGLYEAMSWARWGAVKWVQNQPRAVADNTFDEDYKVKTESFLPSVPHEEFSNIIKPAFGPDITKAHMNAIFKRSVFVVNTDTHIYYRKAGINQDRIPRIEIPNAEYMTDAGKALYGVFKDGGRLLPPDFNAQVRREQEWVSKLVEKRQQERRPDHQKRLQVREALFGREPTSSEPLHRRIKREQAGAHAEAVSKKARTWATELKASKSVIDLDTPPRRSSEPARLVHVPNPDFANDSEEMDVVSEEENDPLGLGMHMD
ncbi:unnamed protein product [Symbiodinium sp. CCMP2592]|nr:unnamed protein product [Symbiodinium sp. CCMP2592]